MDATSLRWKGRNSINPLIKGTTTQEWVRAMTMTVVGSKSHRVTVGITKPIIRSPPGISKMEFIENCQARRCEISVEASRGGARPVFFEPEPSSSLVHSSLNQPELPKADFYAEPACFNEPGFEPSKNAGLGSVKLMTY